MRIVIQMMMPMPIHNLRMTWFTSASELELISWRKSIRDAYLACCFELGEDPEREKISFPDWLSKLSFQLINNTFDSVSFASPVGRRNGTPVSRSAVVKPLHEQHALFNICLLDEFKGAWMTCLSCQILMSTPDQTNPRRKCSVRGCTRKTELYCADCSIIDGNGSRLFFCCGAGQRVQFDRHVWSYHLWSFSLLNSYILRTNRGRHH